jgi:L-serine deaminase
MSTAKASAIIDSIERDGLTLVEVVAALRAIVVELDATQARLDTVDDDIEECASKTLVEGNERAIDRRVDRIETELERRIGHVEDDVSKIGDAVNALERAGS